MDKIQLIAGKKQASAQAVSSISFSDTMRLLLDEARPGQSRTELLRAVYVKSGRTSVVDGPVVIPCP